VNNQQGWLTDVFVQELLIISVYIHIITVIGIIINLPRFVTPVVESFHPFPIRYNAFAQELLKMNQLAVSNTTHKE